METKKYQLPKEFGQKWVKALRSKKYKQGTNRLCTGDAYCCLGVAGVIAGMGKETLEDNTILGERITNDTAIPKALIGNASDSPFISFLVTHNDGEQNPETNPNGEKWGFRKIADWIETNVEFI